MYKWRISTSRTSSKIIQLLKINVHAYCICTNLSRDDKASWGIVAPLLGCYYMKLHCVNLQVVQWYGRTAITAVESCWPSCRGCSSYSRCHFHSASVFGYASNSVVYKLNMRPDSARSRRNRGRTGGPAAPRFHTLIASDATDSAYCTAAIGSAINGDHKWISNSSSIARSLYKVPLAFWSRPTQQFWASENED